MPNSPIILKKIKNGIIVGMTMQFILPLVLNSILPLLKNFTDGGLIVFLLPILAFLLFCVGYGINAEAIDNYAQYKGYKNHLFIFSILNIFGWSILFLLPSKYAVDSKDNKEPIEKFSIKAIFASYLIIPLLALPVLLIAAGLFVGLDNLENFYKNDKSYAAISNLVVGGGIAWYFFQELKRVNLDLQLLLGSLKKINFKLSIGLAVIKYLFVWGANKITLYGLSFLVPLYVENQVNYVYADTPASWFLFLVYALIYAPIMEELFYRGIIFQKLALRKGMLYGLSISAILFAIVHFRYDILPLFITGIITAILYFKTKQLGTAIVYHFAFNFIVVAIELFTHTDPSVQTTVIEYQQNFIDNWELYVLLLTISVPYLAYFIYMNFPQKSSVNRLPYMVNQRKLS